MFKSLFAYLFYTIPAHMSYPVSYFKDVDDTVQQIYGCMFDAFIFVLGCKLISHSCLSPHVM